VAIDAGGCVRVLRSSRVAWLSVLIVVAMPLAACGDAGDADDAATAVATTRAEARRAPPAAPVDDVARAESALVRLTDFPEGWSEQSGTVTRLRCGSFEPWAGASALVRSRRLTQDHAGVQERIALYPTEAAARTALRRLDSRTAADCLRRELRRHVSEESGGPATPARLVRLDRLGPHAHAKRYLSISVSNYGKVVGYIDAVHQRVGRTVAALVFVTGPAAPDEALYDRVVALVSRRLQTALG